MVGGEKMRQVIGPKATDIVAAMTHPEAEYIYGVTLPAMAGMPYTRPPPIDPTWSSWISTCRSWMAWKRR